MDNGNGSANSQISEGQITEKKKRGPKKKVEVPSEKANVNSVDIFDTLREYQNYLNSNNLIDDKIIEFGLEIKDAKNPINRISIRSEILKEFNKLSLNYKLLNSNELFSIAMFEFIKKYR